MKTVGPGLGNYVYHRTGIPSVLSIEGVGDDAELLDAVRRGLYGWQVHELVVRIAAVYAEVVRPGTASIDRHRSGIVRAEEEAAAAAQLRLHSRL